MPHISFQKIDLNFVKEGKSTQANIGYENQPKIVKKSSKKEQKKREKKREKKRKKSEKKAKYFRKKTIPPPSQ